MNVAKWLSDLGLTRYLDKFRENEIDGEILPTLDAEDLKDIGVTIVGHRRKILNAIVALKSEAIDPASTELPDPCQPAPNLTMPPPRKKRCLRSLERFRH